MNLLGPELVRDLVSLIRRAELYEGAKVLVFTSADADYFISPRAHPLTAAPTARLAFMSSE
jgi:hypothetical protein